jgi:hypothetical protein
METALAFLAIAVDWFRSFTLSDLKFFVLLAVVLWMPGYVRKLNDRREKGLAEAVAVRCSSASSRSRVSRATSVSWPAGGLRRTAAFGALLRFRAAVLRRRVLTGSPPALERRLIASPETQDKASCRLKIAHWKRSGAALGAGR